MHTKPEGDEVGTRICVKGSEVIAQEVCTTPKGTSIQVKNLFFNIPARRNFLKSNQSEYNHILKEFNRVALVHPELSFYLYHNDSENYALTATNFRQRIVQIFGRKNDERLVPVEEGTDVVKIQGFIIKPEFAKKTYGEQYFFVNDRYFYSKNLSNAVAAAFEGLLKPDTIPGFFINLEVDPATIDVNVHPTKTQIKFENERSIYVLLKSAIKHSLGQFNIAPILDFDRDKSLDVPYHVSKGETKTPTIQVDPNFNPFQQESSSTFVPPSMPNCQSGGSGRGATTKFSSFGTMKSAKPPVSDQWKEVYAVLDDKSDDQSIAPIPVEREIDSLFTDDQEVTVDRNDFLFQFQQNILLPKHNLVS